MMNSNNNESLFGSICLTDIPKELIKTGKNGKKYLSVVVNRRKEVGQYGHTHYIKAYAKKGTIDAPVNLYIGELKPSDYNDQQGGGQYPQQNSPQGMGWNPSNTGFDGLGAISDPTDEDLPF